MPWLDEVSDPAELKLCVRNLVALSALPALWGSMTSAEMCENLGGALAGMFDAELVYLRLTEVGGEVIEEAAHTRLGPADGIEPALRQSLAPWIARRDEPAGTIGNPFGAGNLAIVSTGIGSEQGVIVIGAQTPKFPTAVQRLLLDVAAEEIATALWQRRTAEAAGRFRSMVERSSEFIGIADVEGNVDYLNPAGRAMVGAAGTGELTGTSVLDYVAKGDRDRIRGQVLPQAVQNGRWSGEFSLRHSVSGKQIPVFAEFFTIGQPHTGAPMNIAAVSHGIPEADPFSRRLRRDNEELEARIARQGAELTGLRERLLAEVKERERAEARLHEVHLELFHAMRVGATGQMAASLAHSLSQPLTAAANSLGITRRIIQSDSERSEALEAISAALEQINRASTILHQLRSFIGRGRTNRQLEDIAAILDDAVAFAMIDANALGIRLVVNQDPAATQVYVDRLQVQQVIVNLVRNAMEAMAHSARRELGIDVTRRPDGMVEIAVSDTGPGLAKEVADRLFTPFVTTKGSGLGLGLAVSKAMVQANGGELTASPRAGVGMVFRFTLASGPPEVLA